MEESKTTHRRICRRLNCHQDTRKHRMYIAGVAGSVEAGTLGRDQSTNQPTSQPANQPTSLSKYQPTSHSPLLAAISASSYYPMVIILFVALWIGSDNLFNANPYSGGDGLCDIIPDSCPVGNGFSTYGPVDGDDFNAPCALCDDQTCCTQEGYDNKVDYTTFVTNPGLSNSCHELLSKMSCAPCR